VRKLGNCEKEKGQKPLGSILKTKEKANEKKCRRAKENEEAKKFKTK